ncbi:hypothetical protein ACFYNZ_08535 [Streptomyces kebangsaanensis]|uniref:MFS transporter n=1 Tax=Streptomyces kebangsaanensis TaxID=864058 RepID=A0ABW6KNT7_9ACTN
MTNTAPATTGLSPHPQAQAQRRILTVLVVSQVLSGVGLASGAVVAAAGYPVLALAGGILSLALLPAVAVTASSR